MDAPTPTALLLAEVLAAVLIVALAIRRIRAIWLQVRRQPFGINPRQVKALYWPGMWIVAVIGLLVLRMSS